MVRSGITVEELEKWGGADTFAQALALVNSNTISDVAYDDETLTVSGKIEQGDGWTMPVSFHLEPAGRIKSLCPCFQNQQLSQICPHVVAIGLALFALENDAAEVPSAENGTEGEPDATEDNQDADFIEVPASPTFYAYIDGSRTCLTVEIDAYYGEINFPACSLQQNRVIWLEDGNDPLVRRTRNLPAERDAVKTIESYGFTLGYNAKSSVYVLDDQHAILNFLGAGIPHLRRRWKQVDLSPKLGHLIDQMPTVAPQVMIQDAPGGTFDVSYSFTAFCDNGAAEVNPAELQAAINRGDGYIMKDGAITLLDHCAIEAMHDIFRDVSSSQGGAPAGWFRVRSLHAPYVKSSLEHFGVAYDDSAANNWRIIANTRNHNDEAKYEPVSLGELDQVLRPYQKQGVYWMRFLENAGLCGLLADEMGLGKTLQTLAWLSLPRVNSSEDEPELPSLIVCPTSLVRNWEAEAEKFTPWVEKLVISGPDRASDFKRIRSARLVITSYALLQRDFEEAYADQEFAAVVLDEAQHIKNRQTRNARAAKNLRARHRLVLTGTPVENSVADVWSIFDFLMPDYLGDYDSFKVSYEIPISEGGDTAEAIQSKLRRKLHPFILRRLKESVAKDLPDKLVKVSYCTMPEDTQREYNEVLTTERRTAKTRFQMLALLMKLRQIASHGKTESFLDVLDEAIDGGHRVLVFSQFVKQLNVLAEELRKAEIPFCYLDGSTKDRLGECNRFNRDQSIPVFLISLMAGGTGLNLTGADMVIHYDPWWNPAVEDQATDRAHRIGQKKKVYVVKLIAADSIEEKVLTLQRRKKAVIAATVETSDTAIIEKLSAADLTELLS